MTTAAPDDPPPALLLGPVLGTLPDLLFQQEVLRRLGPTDLASLSGAGRGCAAAVEATALVRWAKRAKLPPPEHPVWWYLLPPLCLKRACSYAAGGGNREVLEWLHNTGCPWDATTARAAACGALRDDAVALQPWLPVGCVDLCVCRSVRAPARVAVGAGAPLPLGLVDAGMGC